MITMAATELNIRLIVEAIIVNHSISNWT